MPNAHMGISNISNILILSIQEFLEIRDDPKIISILSRNNIFTSHTFFRFICARIYFFILTTKVVFTQN